MSRSGELIMLMLGEGVLSLIISPASTQGYCSPEKRGDTCYFCASKCRLQVLKHVVSFAAAFLMVTSLMYLYFRANVRAVATAVCRECCLRTVHHRARVCVCPPVGHSA